ncbi:hypothetical protein EA147_15840 [Providencia stuartii]|nr:hypothetical protein EA147_15840 [Providencia stuartii]
MVRESALNGSITAIIAQLTEKKDQKSSPNIKKQSEDRVWFVLSPTIYFAQLKQNNPYLLQFVDLPKTRLQQKVLKIS